MPALPPVSAASADAPPLPLNHIRVLGLAVGLTRKI